LRGVAAPRRPGVDARGYATYIIWYDTAQRQKWAGRGSPFLVVEGGSRQPLGAGGSSLFAFEVFVLILEGLVALSRLIRSIKHFRQPKQPTRRRRRRQPRGLPVKLE
jgi:hypothetical protein